jgi:Raf kinase inhibitor-like YbhB/YbcL family protein
MKRTMLVLVLLGFCMQAPLAAAAFTVKSTLKPNSMMPEENVFDGFGCTGKNLSPELSWSGAPKDTKFFAVTVYDPDAPTGSGWWHWVAFNIPSTVTKLAANASKEGMPEGTVQSKTDFGKTGYGGPCPPPGKPHRYIFKVFALKGKIELNEESPAAMAGFYLNQNKLAETSVTFKYKR